MTKIQIAKYIKANQACRKFLKAPYGVHSFIRTILINLNCGSIKKVQNRFSKAQEFLSLEDYKEFKADMLGYRGEVTAYAGEWDDLVQK